MPDGRLMGYQRAPSPASQFLPLLLAVVAAAAASAAAAITAPLTLTNDCPNHTVVLTAKLYLRDPSFNRSLCDIVEEGQSDEEGFCVIQDIRLAPAGADGSELGLPVEGPLLRTWYFTAYRQDAPGARYGDDGVWFDENGQSCTQDDDTGCFQWAAHEGNVALFCLDAPPPLPPASFPPPPLLPPSPSPSPPPPPLDALPDPSLPPAPVGSGPPPPPPPTTKQSSSMGAIIGGVAGGLAAVAAAGAAAFFVARRRRQARQRDLEGGGTGPTPLPLPPPPHAPSTDDDWKGGGSSGQVPGARISGSYSGRCNSLVPSTHSESAGQVVRGDTAADDAGVAGSAGIEPALSAPQLQVASMGSAGRQPGTPPIPAAVKQATSASPTAARSEASSLNQDPVLAYIKSQMSLLSSGTSATTTSSTRAQLRAAAGALDLRTWAIPFQELTMVRPIGEGSFGRVFLALWNHATVAVKVIIDRDAMHRSSGPEALIAPPDLQAKLDEEAALMAGMRHPNVVNFIGLCDVPPCMVTEYCSRGSLTDVLMTARQDPRAAAQLGWPRRLYMALDAACGMAYLHTRPSPIIHRDLKSPNLLVDERLRVKVSDFNLSRLVEESTRSSSVAVMNPRWLAPEVLRGEKASKASDVFSFGVIMWELLSWKVPWSTANGWQLAAQIVGGARLEVPRREELPPGAEDTPDAASYDAYVALMRQCWADDPSQRPAFKDISAQLRALLERHYSSVTGTEACP